MRASSADRHRGGARAAGRARGADRRGLRRRRPHRHARTAPIRPAPSTSRCRPSRRRRSARFSTSRNFRSRSTACAIVGEAVADGGGREPAGGARRRRGGRGRVRGAAGRHRRRARRSPTARRRSGRRRPAISRSTMHSATAPRSRPRWRGRISWSSRPSATSAPQRLHGAALGDRRLRCGEQQYTLISGMPGRPSPAQRARRLPQGAAGASPRRLPGRRRRLRIAHQSLSRAGRGGVGGAPRRPAGEMDQRPHRGVPHRLHGARCGDHGAARARPPRPHPGARRSSSPPIPARTRSPTCRSATAIASRRPSTTCRSPARALRAVMTNTVPTAPFRGAGRPEATSVHGAADRHRGAAAEDRPRRAAPPQSDPRTTSCRTAPPPGSPTTAATSPAT